MKLQALVLKGDGINCEHESAEACNQGGFETKVLHVNDFLSNAAKELAAVQLLVLPGGFSFGDELGSGKILALKLKARCHEALMRYVDRGGAILGICNGFQVLTQLGVFGPNLILSQNIGGHFQNRWVGLRITGKSIFTDALKARGQTHLELPVRHGEGRLVVTDWQPNSEQCVVQYEEEVNGSWNQVAALSAHDGRVLGIMPHPESFWTRSLHPNSEAIQDLPLGTELFKNAYEVLKKTGAKNEF